MYVYEIVMFFCPYQLQTINYKKPINRSVDRASYGVVFFFSSKLNAFLDNIYIYTYYTKYDFWCFIINSTIHGIDAKYLSKAAIACESLLISNRVHIKRCLFFFLSHQEISITNSKVDEPIYSHFNNLCSH